MWKAWQRVQIAIALGIWTLSELRHVDIAMVAQSVTSFWQITATGSRQVHSRFNAEIGAALRRSAVSHR